MKLLLLCSMLFGALFAQMLEFPNLHVPLFLSGDFNIAYFGRAPPSDINPDWIGPHMFLHSNNVDLDKGTITLPLYHGIVMNATQSNGTDQWFILTDAGNKDVADAFGINFSYKLNFVPNDALRLGTLDGSGLWMFESGLVDFSMNVNISENANQTFPPLESTTAGSVGDADYSPVIRLENGWIFNAPVIAQGVSMEELNVYCEGISENQMEHAYSILHDQVVSICPRRQEVTMRMTPGFSQGRPILYLGMAANNMIMAAMENATFVPKWSHVIPTGCFDVASCAVERAFAIINGYTLSEMSEMFNLDVTGANVTLPPLRQGLNSLLMDHMSALYVFGEIPTSGVYYSPLWDFHLTEWTQEAVSERLRTRLTDEFQIYSWVRSNFLTGSQGTLIAPIDLIFDAPVAYRLW
jgi:hypothetical protein